MTDRLHEAFPGADTIDKRAVTYLYSLDELLAMRSNAWACDNCGRAWADTPIPGLSAPITDGLGECNHQTLRRALLSQ